jgi:hypothetical protein
VSEVADARDNEFLRAVLGGGDIGGCLDPFDGIANLLDGIDERADVAGNVVE